ncbi:hypothetical protein LOTGIDRAFT_156829 [Lottia gigantea]|uniref:Uncharacterized protein n=1 Tax=Lottia gigantea TaxID=225164 RepID=V4AYW2_LOTGI|nr:hypothetical protein LOTGIDRAFT_156829 [Lottia gigantea]ESP02878.1 hypothetical protein LOTGIDRAFT_156829 [Lottia gigantea]
MKPVLKEFMSETTCHGWKYVGDNKSSIYIRMIWLAVVLALLGGLSYTLIKTYVSYKEHRFLTVTRTERREEIPFPGITLCNRGMYSNSSGFITEEIAEYIMKSAQNGYDWSTPDSKKIANVSIAQFLEATAFDWQKMINYLMIGYNPIQTSTLETIDTEEGRCLIINGPQYVSTNGRLKLQQMGSDRGLTLSLVTFQDNYVPTVAMDAGFELFLHEPYETIKIRSGGILLSPGTNNLISLRPVEYKLLPYPYKSHGKDHCLEENNERFEHIKKLYGYKEYSRDSCLRDCTANATVHECGCKTLLETVKNVVRAEKKELCDCPWPCRQITYETKLSNTLFPSVTGVNYINKLYNTSLTVESARNNLLQVKIFFKDMFYTEIKHVPEFDFDSIFGRVGGQMGLFLGASLVSAFELLVYMVKFIWNGVEGHRANTKKTNIQPLSEKSIPG